VRNCVFAAFLQRFLQTPERGVPTAVTGASGSDFCAIFAVWHKQRKNSMVFARQAA
jgi:hypothetical protein